MKITTRAVFDIESGALLEWEGFEYTDSGPLALCDRAQSKAVANQGMAQSAQNQQQGSESFSAGMSGVQDLQNQAQQFRRQNPYRIGGQFQRDQSQINADTSSAGTNSLNDAMKLNAVRTGQNEASYAPALAEAQRSASRDLATSEAKADQQRIASDVAYRQAAVGMSGLAPDLASRLYGTATGGASSNLNPAASAAKTPGFMDTLVPALISGGAEVGKGFTPGGAGG